MNLNLKLRMSPNVPHSVGVIREGFTFAGATVLAIDLLFRKRERGDVGAVATAGTTVLMKDSAPVGDRYNLILVEIPAAH